VKNYKLFWIVLASCLFLQLFAGPVISYSASATAIQIINDLNNAGIYFDEGRFPDDVVKGFINDIQEEIAVIGLACKKECIISLNNLEEIHLLPDDFIMHEAVDLNGDPTTLSGDYNYRRTITYVNPREFGKGFEFQNNRPEQYTIWWDTFGRPYIQIMPPEQLGNSDSLFIKYYYMPDSIVSTFYTLNIPQRYIPLVRERLKEMCIQRVVFTAPDKNAIYQTLFELRKALLGRPSDVGYRQDYIQPTVSDNR